MTILIAGASGATGKLLVDQLLLSGHNVKLIVRSRKNIPGVWNGNSNVTLIEKGLTDMTVEEMAAHLAGCDAIASCLGHNPTMRGIFGKPRRLVTDAVRLLCSAVSVNRPVRPTRFVLMNSAGCRNRDLDEPISIGQRLVIALIRLLVPPHADNEQAADHLRVNIGQNNSFVEWIVVRPDTLINEEKVSEYTLHPSPTTSAIFKPGKTSRINVGHVMASLITDDRLWSEWKGKMPIIYNAAS